MIINSERLLFESQIEQQNDTSVLADGEAQRQAEAAARQEQARLEAERAQAAALEQLEAARLAAEAAAFVTPVTLPNDQELVDQAVLLSVEPGIYAQELEGRLAGVSVPDDLQFAVDNLREAFADVDALMQRGLFAQAEAMRAALEEPLQALLARLGAQHETPAAPAPAAVEPPASPLEPEPLPQANDYFTGNFETPPPGGWFWSVGDTGQTGAALYNWLPEAVAVRAEASEHGHYLLAASNEVTTVDAMLAQAATYAVDVQEPTYDDYGMSMRTVTRQLGRDEAISVLRASGMDDAAIAAYLSEHETFKVREGGSTGEDYIQPVYGTRSDYLNATGLGENAPGDLQVTFNASFAQSGDAWLDANHTQTSLSLGMGPERAYTAIVDDRLAPEWVQLGDIGPLNDDISAMLGEIYQRYGADTPEKQETLRGALFKYDERFGVLASREFVAAACDRNNARRQGFFEGPVGRALLTVAASFIPGAGPYVAIMLNAGFQLSDGAPIGRVITGAAISYFTQQYGQQFGHWVAGAFGEGISPAMAEVIAAGARNLGATAVAQLASGNGLDAKGLLVAAAAGGFGSYVTKFVDGSDFGRALDAQFGQGRAGDILGRLTASALDGRLSAEDFIAAFAPGRADQIKEVQTPAGKQVFVQTQNGLLAYNEGLGMTHLTEGPDGTPIAVVYDAEGSVVGWFDVTTKSVVPAPSTDTSSSTDFVRPHVPTQVFDDYSTMFMSPGSPETYASWDAVAAAGQPLFASSVPASIADIAANATVRMQVLDENGRFSGLGSGALGIANIGGVDQVVLTTVGHVLAAAINEGGVHELGSSEIRVMTGNGTSILIPFDQATVVTNLILGEDGRYTANGSNEQALLVLPPELAATLDLSRLPRVSTEVEPGTAFTAGFPGYTDAVAGSDSRLLVIAEMDVSGEDGDLLVGTTVSSRTNPPQSGGASGGPLFVERNGQVFLVGNYAQTSPAADADGNVDLDRQNVRWGKIRLPGS